jgi:MerR family redox-sensitive transcriptional activator SoxR
MEELTIGDVAHRAGIRTSTIRYYESIDILPAPRRVAGRRMYSATILDRLAFIRITQKLGFSLAEIQLLFHNRDGETPLPERWQTLARQKLAEADAVIQHAIDMKQLLVQGLECNCPDLLDCIECILLNCYEPKQD